MYIMTLDIKYKEVKESLQIKIAITPIKMSEKQKKKRSFPSAFTVLATYFSFSCSFNLHRSVRSILKTNL